MKRSLSYAAAGVYAVAVVISVPMGRAVVAHPAAGPSVVRDGNEIAGIAAARAGDASADLAYMRAHPVPPRPGVTEGIITSVTELGDQPGTGLDSAQCAAVRTAAYLAPAVGQDPCIAWYFTVITPDGKTLRVSCGALGAPCLAPQNVMPGDEGQYLYVPSGGEVTPVAPVAFIGCVTAVTYPCPSSAAVIP